MARASYLESARAMALGTPPLAWFYTAAWPVFTPPLTIGGIIVTSHTHIGLTEQNPTITWSTRLVCFKPGF
jgi:hypothetical protein